MNKIKSTLLLLVTATLSMGATLQGSVGCMDNSQYLRQSFDTKAYHYVTCDCKCRSHAPGSNRCARCGHINVPQEQEYVATHVDAQRPARSTAPTKQLKTKKESQLSALMQNPDVKLKQMIKTYTASKTATLNRD